MTSESNTPVLIVVKGPAKDKVFSLGTNLITVGRGEDADIRLPDDKSISRIHLNLRLAGNNRYVLSNRSDNGTIVNDKLVDEKELASGDRIRIGDVYVLEFSDGSKPVSVPKPSLFKKPIVLIMCGVYVAALIAGAMFLSNAPSEEDGPDSARVTEALQANNRFMKSAKLAQPEQEARQRAVHAYLRAAFIAEREGNYREARRVYLKVMDYTKDGRSPIYQFALERLRSVPVEQK
jgi:pSer/pThr/pTyr-binding forkhead associated (FHA) protein